MGAAGRFPAGDLRSSAELVADGLRGPAQVADRLAVEQGVVVPAVFAEEGPGQVSGAFFGVR